MPGFHFNARALDLLARRGLAERLVGEGWQAPHAAFSGLPVTLSLAGTRTDPPYSPGIPQTRVEQILEEHALARGADIRRGHELLAVEQDDESVTATVSTGDEEYRVRAAYLVGCDGGRSTVRKQAGIGFPGTEATRYSSLGDVELADPEALPFIPRPGYVRIIASDRHPRRTRTPRSPWTSSGAAVDDALGRHVELRAARWLTRFGNAARQASEYVRGRVVLAGDAAHTQSPRHAPTTPASGPSSCGLTGTPPGCAPPMTTTSTGSAKRCGTGTARRPRPPPRPRRRRPSCVVPASRVPGAATGRGTTARRSRRRGRGAGRAGQPCQLCGAR
nr:FAD-dependent monooxygenase [Streptomyces marincola]